MSCLFRSLASFIDNISETELRKMIADYLQTDPFIFNNPDQRLSDILKIDNIHLHDYVELMRKEHTWGGAIEIKAFCDMFQSKVVVHIQSSKKTVEFYPHNEIIRCEFFIHWDGGHYEPVLSQ